MLPLPAKDTWEFYARAVFRVDILPLHHFLTACVCAIIACWWWGGGEVMYFIATCGNVAVQTLIIPASCECGIPVASWAVWDSDDAGEFVISCSLMNRTPPPPHRSKLKTSRTSRTSSAWWPWPGRTPPPSPMCSPSTTSASRRSAATTRLTCKSFQTWAHIKCEKTPSLKMGAQTNLLICFGGATDLKWSEKLIKFWFQRAQLQTDTVVAGLWLQRKLCFKQRKWNLIPKHTSQLCKTDRMKKYRWNELITPY